MIDIIHRLFLGLWQGLCRAAYHVRYFFRYLYTGKPYDSPFPPNANLFSAALCFSGCLAVLPLSMLALSVGFMRTFLYPSFKKKKWPETFFCCLVLAVIFLEVAVCFWWMVSRPDEYCMFSLGLMLCSAVVFLTFGTGVLFVKKYEEGGYNETKKSYSRCKAKYSKCGNVVRQKFRMVPRNCNTSRNKHKTKNKITTTTS